MTFIPYVTQIKDVLDNVERFVSSDPNAGDEARFHEMVKNAASHFEEIKTPLSWNTPKGEFNGCAHHSIGTVAEKTPNPSLNPDPKFQKVLDPEEVKPDTLTA